MSKYVDITIKCPFCKTTKEIMFYKKDFKEKGSTIFTVAQLICEHTFQVFISNDFIVIGYQKNDLNSLNEIILEDFKEIDVRCPICKAYSRVHLSKHLDLNSSGITVINYPSGSICDHTFSVYIDKHYKVRDYVKADGEIKEIQVVRSVDERFGDIF